MNPRRTWVLIRFLLTWIALFTIWISFAAGWNPFSVTAGLLGSFVLGLLTFRVFIAEHEAGTRSVVPRPLALVRFLAVLLVEIYRSSWTMLRGIVTFQVSPRIVHIRTRLGSDLARMVLANSITLTPGTITLDLNDDHLLVFWFFSTTSHSRAAGEEIKGNLEALLEKVWT